MPYLHDVFISYSRRFPFGQWVEELFIPFFEPYLQAALNRSANVFYDREGILSGDAWPMKLKHGLAHSRCLVAIWSPLYFQSEWCKYECIVMLYRERELGFRTLNNPAGLILPVKVHDGDSYPPYARSVQCENWIQYAKVGEGFRKTEQFAEFQEKMSKWTETVARTIDLAPEWDAAWLSNAWLDNAIAEWISQGSVDDSRAGVSTFTSVPSLA
jgi:hypothetical protein